jgi:hypothetical protein
LTHGRASGDVIDDYQERRLSGDLGQQFEHRHRDAEVLGWDVAGHSEGGVQRRHWQCPVTG